MNGFDVEKLNDNFRNINDNFQGLIDRCDALEKLIDFRILQIEKLKNEFLELKEKIENDRINN